MLIVLTATTVWAAAGATAVALCRAASGADRRCDAACRELIRRRGGTSPPALNR